VSWIPGWDSIAGANTGSNIFFWAGIVALILLGVCEVISHRYGERKDVLVAQEQDETKRKHDEEIARLHLETAQANEHAAELNTALEKEREKTSPRVWKKEQFDAIQSIRGKVTDVGILVQKNCLECFMFGGHLELALHQAGARLYRDDSLETGQGTGIMVYLPADQMGNLDKNFLVVALREAGLNPFVIRHNPTDFSQMRTDIPVIFVGEKVISYFAAPFFPTAPSGWTYGPLRK
jgi:hypothetical protein